MTMRLMTIGTGLLWLSWGTQVRGQETPDVAGGEIGEVKVWGISGKDALTRAKLQVLTAEPEAWGASITEVCPADVPGACTLFEALKYTTNGVASTQGRRKKHYYLLRGQNVASDYAVNGVSLSTNGAGPMAEWVEAPTLLPTAMIEEVEVIRSGNSLLLGFSGLNGVVNVKTRRFEYATTQVEGDYGSFETLHLGALHGGRIGNVHYAASVERDRTSGPAGRHSFEDMWKVYAKAEYCLGERFEASVENLYVYGVRHVTQAVWDSLAAPQSQLADVWEYDPLRYDVATARLKWHPTESLSTELQGSMILNRMDLYPDRYAYHSTGKVIELEDSIARQRMLDEPDTIYTAALFQGWSPTEGNVLRAGMMYASSTTYAHGRSHRSILSATLLDEHSFGAVAVHGGVKAIRDASSWLVNVSGGVKRRGWSAVLNSGRMPADVTEQTEDGKRLKQELRTGAELGWRGAGMVVTLFAMDQRNTSEYTRKPYYDERGTLRYYMRNVDLQTVGIEASGRWQLNAWLSGFANASLKYVSESGSDYRRRYTRQPPLIANVGVNIVPWEALTGGKVDICVLGKYVSAYTTDRFLRREVGVGNYCNVDVHGRWRINSYLEAYGGLSNAGDVRYATVSPLYPDFGRTWRLGLRGIY
jgi:iron complex outermembrane receptor protein